MSLPPQAPPKDRYQQLKEEYHRLRDEYKQSRAIIDNYDRELKRRTIELNNLKGNHHINHLQHESQLSNFIRDLLNLINVYQKLDPKTLPDVSGPQVSSTKSEVGDAQAAHTSNDPQHSKGPTEDTSAKGSSAHHPSAQALLGNQRQYQTSQSTPQVSSAMAAAVEGITSFIIGPTQAPPKDRYQQLKEEYHRLRDQYKQSRVIIENYDRELKRRTMELNKGNRYITHLQHESQHESQRSKDFISDLLNLINVHQKLDPKTLSDASGPQISSTKPDTLSISEAGEKVTALNEEIFQAAATLGETLIRKRYEEYQIDLEEAAAVSQEMVGKKLTNILIAQAQKPEPEVNPLLVQIALQIFMVKFCVSKIQSWYPGDSTVEEFLSAIYSEIRSTGRASN